MNALKIIFETKMAVNMFATSPMLSVTPKPFTGPVPKMKRNTAAMSVVILESKIAENE